MNRHRHVFVSVVVAILLAAVVTALTSLPSNQRVYADLNCTGSGHTDDFTSTTLNSAWTPYKFAGGPTYSLTANPGCFRLTVPSSGVFDQWTAVDNAPQLQRGDMGANSWVLETKLSLQTYTPGANFNTGLMVRFGQYDALYWGFFQGTTLRLDRSGNGGIITANYNSPIVYLQIQKTGANYTFLHKANAGDQWIVDGNYSTTSTVANVGFITKTFTTPNAVTTDFDYVNLVTSASPDTDCSSAGVQGAWGSVWTRYKPIKGPLFSLTANPNCQRFYLPNDQAYDQSTTVDNAPQLQRSDLGAGDWTIESEVNLAINPGGYFHTGLMVRFSQYDVLLWGFDNGTNLQVDRTGSSNLVSASFTGTRAFLRVQKSGATYTFSYATASAGPWTTAGTYMTATQVQSVGVMAKTWSPVTVLVDFDYFTMTRVATTAGATCASVNHASDFAGTIDSAWTQYVPQTGPAFSATASPGCVRLSVPNDQTYDSWPAVDHAPQLQRGDMGSADWTLETKANLVSNPGGSFQSGLMVRFGQYDLFYWGFDNGTNLQLDRSGTAGLITASYSQPVVYLRIQKSGTTYTFSYKAPGDLSWTTAGTATSTASVQQVGLITKTFAPVTVVTDFDYVNLTPTDNFSATTINTAWSQYVPATGPTWSVTANPGFARLSIPNTQAYDSWTAVDNAPQFQRGDMGSADWAIETKATLVSNPGGFFQTGLMVRFSQYDLFYWGFDNGANLQLDRSGSPGLIKIPNTATTVWLRIQRIGSYYLFSHKTASSDPWMYDGYQGPVTNAVSNVGLIGKTWNPVALTVDFDYFSLTPVSGN